MDLISKLLVEYGIDPQTVVYLSNIIMILFIIILCLAGHFIARYIVVRGFTKIVAKRNLQWGRIFLERKVLRKFAHIVPVLIIYYFSSAFTAYQHAIEKGAIMYLVLMGIIVLNALLNAGDDIYSTYEVSKVRPIKGYVQVVKIFIFVMGGIVVIANLIGQNPVILLSGLGALSAVLMLIFKDSILGLVAGVQLTTNDMVRVGDWIEMPKYQADGDVIEISLNTIKVLNWDKTITTIPSYALISDSFKNWRSMHNTGGRRIKRSIYIDTHSITFCTKEMIEEFKKIHYLEEHILHKEQEIEAHNIEHQINKSNKVNGRQLTNIGVFRAYIQKYLDHHPNIHKELIYMVRQLAPGENGLPIEIYAFVNDTRWTVYETVQSDIFDHIFAVAPEFGLRIFQNPTGHDFKNLLELNQS